MRRVITKRVVESLKEGAVCWDSRIPGFGVRRRARGIFYALKYGLGVRGASRWLTIGEHGGPWVREGRPCTLTAELAREEAIRLLGERARGADPAKRRDAQRGIPTFQAFASRYLAEYAEVHKRPSSAKQDDANLRRVLLPALGRYRLDQITVADVTQLHLSRRRTPTNANRCLALVSHMFSTAARWGITTEAGDRIANPCRDVERYSEERRRRFLSVEELARLGGVLSRAEADQPMAVAAIRLLIFTGCRRSEILELKWEDVDMSQGVLRLSSSKTGAREVLLNPPAMQVLAKARRWRIKGNPFVLPGMKAGQHYVGVGHVWERLRRDAILGPVRLHDLRHSFASVAVSAGASLPVIGGLLGHVQASTTQRYAHLHRDPLRDASDRTGEMIATAMRAGASRGK